MTMKRSLLTLLALMILAAPVLADVPKTMNIQGVLTDPAGNPVTDGDYNVNFLFYSSEFATTPMFTNDWDIWVVDGLFSHVMDMEPWLDLGVFANELWLGIAISGEAEQTPRMRLTSTPYAFRAAIADSVVGGGGGADSDWEIVGDDVYHTNGTVYMGTTAPGARNDDVAEEPRGGIRGPSFSKARVEATNQTGLYSVMTDSDGLTNQRAAVYGHRQRSTQNDGTGFGAGQVSGGTLGYTDWGDSYTFGVAGHTWFDFAHTAGVLGANQSGSLWGALAYRDAVGGTWGFYTPANAHIGGTLQLPSGATAGHVLTSDADGNASWQAGGAGGADDDWATSGDDIFRLLGDVYVGFDPGGNPRAPSTVKMGVVGENEGFAAYMQETDAASDKRFAVHGQRDRDVRNDGTGFGTSGINAAVGGQNDWGDSYTFGVVGHTSFDFPFTGGVLGSDSGGSIWGALGYQDGASNPWGLYTPSNAYVGSTATMYGLRLPTGAVAGHILTSDGTGTASWQPPGAAGTDSDWTISGDDLFHDTTGTVAIGTDSPSTIAPTQAMLQVNASLWPALALDSQANGFSRWVIMNEGIGDELEFCYTTSHDAYPSTKMLLSDDGRMAVGNSLSGATLSLGAGNGDLSVGNGDFYVGGSSYGFKLGVHTAGGQAGEVNLRADTSTGGGVLDLGVDNHDIMRLEENEMKMFDSGGAERVRVTTEDSMGDTGGSVKLYSATSSTVPVMTILTTTTGEGLIDINQPGGSNSVYIDSNGPSYGGGEIKLYNDSGVQTLKLDAHHDASGQSRITTASLEITGGADLSEQFDVGDDGDQAEPGMVLCIDPQRPGRLAMSGGAYDRRVAGVVSGAGGVRTGMLMGQRGSEADGELPVALAGRVYVWADASDGPIEPGDLLTTADRPGHAMRVKDHDRAGGAILGKAMTGLSEGRGLVLVLVSLQ
jgi:hypothetical protein